MPYAMIFRPTGRPFNSAHAVAGVSPGSVSITLSGPGTTFTPMTPVVIAPISENDTSGYFCRQ